MKRIRDYKYTRRRAWAEKVIRKEGVRPYIIAADGRLYWDGFTITMNDRLETTYCSGDLLIAVRMLARDGEWGEAVKDAIIDVRHDNLEDVLKKANAGVAWFDKDRDYVRDHHVHPFCPANILGEHLGDDACIFCGQALKPAATIQGV